MDLLEQRRLDPRQALGRVPRRRACGGLSASSLLALAALALGACRALDRARAPIPQAADAAAGAPLERTSAVEDARLTSTPERDAPAVTSQSPSDPQADPQLRELLAAYYRDFAAGDWNALAQHFWPEATLVTIRRRGLEANSSVVVVRIDDYVRRHLAGQSRPAALRIALESSRIETIGSVASAVTHYRALDPSGQEAQSWSGSDLFSLVRHDGHWRIASLVFEGAHFGR